MAKPAIQKYFKDYASFHRTRGNQVCHLVGIPLLTLTILGLLGDVSFSASPDSGLLRADLGVFLWCAASIWYFLLDWRLGLPFSMVALGGYFIGRAIPVPALWALFVIGWVIQAVGHFFYEKKSPAFFRNFLHLLIGPLWIFAKILGYQAG